MDYTINKILAILGVILFIWGIFTLTDSIIYSEDEEIYDHYISIRDTCPCTIEHDAECRNHSGCIHAYEYCQRESCPDCFVR
jgi:hypothetical protein